MDAIQLVSSQLHRVYANRLTREQIENSLDFDDVDAPPVSSDRRNRPYLISAK